MHALTQSCVLFLWMHALTVVESRDCLLNTFLESSMYDTNFDTSTLEAKYADKTQVRVGCNVGYSGFFKLICDDGTWKKRGKECEPRFCGHPGDAQFADFQLEKGEDFVFGSKVVYICQTGYQMVSRVNYRHCMAEGWDGVVPICEAQQCPIIHVKSNVQVNGNLEDATYGNVVRFSCKYSSQYLVGQSELYCDDKGNWSGNPPECEEIKCATPTIDNGFVVGDDIEYNENEVLRYKCNPKYTRSEQIPSRCTKIGERVEWNPMPSCELTTCKLDLQASDRTTYDPPYKNRFLPGERVRVICANEYWISSKDRTRVETTCGEDGVWTIRPVCQEVVCSSERPNNVRDWYVNWWQIYKLHDTVSYGCRWGFKRTDGSNRAKCTRSGWTPNPLCSAITCKVQHHRDIADIVGQVKRVYRYNERVTYTCKNGNGRFILTCEEGGWNGRPRCAGLPCGKPDIENADFPNSLKTSYSDGEQVWYACLHSREKHYTITCENGVWSEIQKCGECPEATIENGFVVGPQNGSLYYACNEDYKLFTSGWWGVAKCDKGLVSGLGKCIEESKCGKIPVIPNGEVPATPSVYHENDSVDIVCQHGFNAQVSKLTCHRGQWNSNSVQLNEVCKPADSNCGAPPKVDNAVIDSTYKKEYLSNFTVSYLCRDGSKIGDENTLQCQDGEWEKKNITCSHVEKTLIAPVEKEQYLNGEVIQYQSATGAESSNATCIDGKWNKTMTCDGLPCGKPDIENADFPNSLKTSYSDGEQVWYACLHSREKHYTITCENGDWSEIQNCGVSAKKSDADLVPGQ